MSARRQRAIKAMDRVRSAETAARNVMHIAYPIGSEIRWERGRGMQTGRIVGHSSFRSGDAFRVENYATGKTYWVDFYWVRS